MRLVALLIAFSIPIFGESQVTTTEYLEWRLEQGAIVWQRVIEKEGIDIDHKKYIGDLMKQDVSINLVSEEEHRMVFDMYRKIFEKRGDLYSARITVDFKDNKFRVTITNIVRYLGERTLTSMKMWAGTSGSEYSGGIPFEDNYCNKKRT